MSRGRLCLLDYGQCVQLDSSKQGLLSTLILQLANRSAENPSSGPLADAAKAIGFQTRGNDPDSLSKLAALFYDEDVSTSPAVSLKSLNRADPIMCLPDDDLFLAARVSLLLRGSSQLLGGSQRLRVAKEWAPFAKRSKSLAS